MKIEDQKIKPLTNLSPLGMLSDEQIRAVKLFASINGKLGGMSKSEKKSKSSRENGKLGGRPRSKP